MDVIWERAEGFNSPPGYLPHAEDLAFPSLCCLHCWQLCSTAVNGKGSPPPAQACLELRVHMVIYLQRGLDGQDWLVGKMGD